MPERRMLANSIINSDFFSSMPVDSQMLYVRLNLSADDDGFVANPRAIMRMYGFGDDSMKLLIAKKFVLSFEYGDNFVFLIKHWRIHNYIRSDRYKASNFRSLLREVYFDENKAYSLTPGEGKTPVLGAGIPSGRQLVYQMDTQDKLGEDNLGEVSLSKDNSSSVSFEEEKQEKEESPAENYSKEDHAARLDRFVKSYLSFKRLGYPTEGIIGLAGTEGVSREEIEEEVKKRNPSLQ